jgi:hypothetical protein
MQTRTKTIIIFIAIIIAGVILYFCKDLIASCFSALQTINWTDVTSNLSNSLNTDLWGTIQKIGSPLAIGGSLTGAAYSIYASSKKIRLMKDDAQTQINQMTNDFSSRLSDTKTQLITEKNQALAEAQSKNEETIKQLTANYDALKVQSETAANTITKQQATINELSTQLKSANETNTQEIADKYLEVYLAKMTK